MLCIKKVLYLCVGFWVCILFEGRGVSGIVLLDFYLLVVGVNYCVVWFVLECCCEGWYV